MPRPWASTNNVYVSPEDHVWVFDRCEDKGCAGSSVAPISGTLSRRLGDENFGAGMFVFPHQVVPGRNGNVWVVAGEPRPAKVCR